MKDGTLKTLLLVALVIVILLLLHFVPSVSVFGVKLRKVNILSQIITLPGDNESTDVIPKPKDPKQIEARSKSGKLLDFKEVWPKGVQPILDYSEGNAGGMDHFYEMVDSAARHKLKGRPVRIAYYGDSFIEGDILVADLREQLQAKYGGSGVGWIDAGNDLEQYKISIGASYTGMTEHMAMKKESYDPSKAGIAERYYTTNGSASMTMTGQKYYPHTSTWTNSRLYFCSAGKAHIVGKLGNGIVSKKSYSASPSVQEFSMSGAKTNKVKFSITGAPVLFGAVAETDGGIVVDNFSMRGSTGITLSTLSERTLSDFNRIRPYDLIVLQFGVNAVSSDTKDEDMHKYLSGMRKVIRLMRKCFPEASILVVSTPDRGNNANGTMPTIKVLEGYQKELAAEEKVGFYSLFHSMGGEGAMARLHERNMTSADLVHVSRGGGKLIANGIFKSIVAGENNYLRRRKLEREN